MHLFDQSFAECVGQLRDNLNRTVQPVFARTGQVDLELGSVDSFDPFTNQHKGFWLYLLSHEVNPNTSLRAKIQIRY